MEMYPSRSPAVPHPSPVSSSFSSVVFVVSMFALRRVFSAASRDSGVGLRAAPLSDSPPPSRPMSILVSLITEKGCWRTRGTGSRYNGVLPSDRRITGACRPTLAHICSKRRPSFSPSFPVVLRALYLSPPPPCPPVERWSEQRWI